MRGVCQTRMITRDLVEEPKSLYLFIKQISNVQVRGEPIAFEILNYRSANFPDVLCLILEGGHYFALNLYNYSVLLRYK